MKTNEIAKAIMINLAERAFLIYMERFEGCGFPEADVFGISGAGQIYEYKIKRSRSDFMADFKKAHKHFNLNNGNPIRTYDEWKKGRKTGNQYTELVMPNRFYFACEPELIKPDELPEYCGLVYISDTYTEIKPAKLLHHFNATEKIYKRCATILSERVVYGCSHVTYKNNKKKEWFAEIEKELSENKNV